MPRLATKIKQLVSKEIKRKPTKKDYIHVYVVKHWVLKGKVSIYYKKKLLGRINLIDK